MTEVADACVPACLVSFSPLSPVHTPCTQPKGGSFTGDDKDFLRFKLGQHQVIPAFEEAVASMKVLDDGRGAGRAAG